MNHYHLHKCLTLILIGKKNSNHYISTTFTDIWPILLQKTTHTERPPIVAPLQFYIYILCNHLQQILCMYLSIFSIRPNRLLTTLAHKQHCSKTCKTSSLYILLKVSADGVRLTPIYVTFHMITN
jgi:hypothetical protein